MHRACTFPKERRNPRRRGMGNNPEEGKKERPGGREKCQSFFKNHVKGGTRDMEKGREEGEPFQQKRSADPARCWGTIPHTASAINRFYRYCTQVRGKSQHENFRNDAATFPRIKNGGAAWKLRYIYRRPDCSTAGCQEENNHPALAFQAGAC